MNDRNEMSIRFDSYSANEGFARVAVAAFLADLDPTLEQTQLFMAMKTGLEKYI